MLPARTEFVKPPHDALRLDSRGAIAPNAWIRVLTDWSHAKAQSCTIRHEPLVSGLVVGQFQISRRWRKVSRVITAYDLKGSSREISRRKQPKERADIEGSKEHHRDHYKERSTLPGHYPQR